METKSEQIEIKEIEETPFTIVKTDKGYFLAMGNYRLTPDKETKEEIEAIIWRKDWNLLVPVIGIIAEKVFTDLKNK